LVNEHRDRIYIRKDIILKLEERDELNQPLPGEAKIDLGIHLQPDS